MTDKNIPLMGHGPHWQELAVGDRFGTFRRTVTETDLVNFISCTGMLEAIFIDDGYEGGAMKGRVVPAALTYTLIEGMQLQSLIQGVGLALLEVSMKAHGPVMVGDSIRATVTIEDIRPTSRNGRAVVRSGVEIVNQHDQVVLTYTVSRLVAGKPD